MADTKYIGKASLTYVRFADGRVGYVERGQLAPSGLDQADLDRLVELGFLLVQPAPELVSAVAPETTVLLADGVTPALAGVAGEPGDLAAPGAPLVKTTKK